MDASLHIFTILLIFILLILMIRGAIQTFERNWVVALILIVLILPIWTGWAIVESFLPSPKNKEKIYKVKIED